MLMRYQETSFSCGAAAVLNAARCLGKRIPERSIRAIADTTPDGTDDSGIIKALTVLGLEGWTFEENHASCAVEKITNNLHSTVGLPTIICTMNLQHWVVVIATTDNQDRFVVVDSSRTKKNMKENGVQVLSKKELIKTWQTRSGKFFGIVVRRPPKKGRKRVSVA